MILAQFKMSSLLTSGTSENPPMDNWTLGSWLSCGDIEGIPVGNTAGERELCNGTRVSGTPLKWRESACCRGSVSLLERDRATIAGERSRLLVFDFDGRAADLVRVITRLSWGVSTGRASMLKFLGRCAPAHILGVSASRTSEICSCAFGVPKAAI